MHDVQRRLASQHIISAIPHVDPRFRKRTLKTRLWRHSKARPATPHFAKRLLQHTLTRALVAELGLRNYGFDDSGDVDALRICVQGIRKEDDLRRCRALGRKIESIAEQLSPMQIFYAATCRVYDHTAQKHGAGIPHYGSHRRSSQHRLRMPIVQFPDIPCIFLTTTHQVHTPHQSLS